MTHPAPMRADASMLARAPTTTWGPIAASGAIRAVASTTADAWIPSGVVVAGCSSEATRAYVAYGLAETSLGSDVATASSGDRMTAAARVPARRLRYLLLA